MRIIHKINLRKFGFKNPTIISLGGHCPLLDPKFFISDNYLFGGSLPPFGPKIFQRRKAADNLTPDKYLFGGSLPPFGPKIFQLRTAQLRKASKNLTPDKHKSTKIIRIELQIPLGRA